MYAGLDLSRQKLDVHVLEDGQTVELTAVRPDPDALRTPAERINGSGSTPPDSHPA